jgi:hypothetical protein
MRLRCPKENCPIDVPDDLVGVRIRCPHCGEWLVVDPKYRDASAEQIRAAVPDMSLGASAEKPALQEPLNLENQIYDGLPPLAVMIAVRRQQGSHFTPDDLAARYPMTDDDWKALSAFESVLVAVVSLHTTLAIGAVTVLVNLLAFAASLEQTQPTNRPFSHAVVVVILGTCFLVIYLGSQTLRRIKLDALANLLPWSASCVALVVGTAALLDVMTIFHERQEQTLGFMVFASIPFNLIAAVDSGKSAWRVGRSLDQVSPPEISHRLTEALRYLQ